MIKIPKTVVDWCSQYKLCEGCKFAVTICAPVSDSDYDNLVLNLIEAIKDELNEKQ